MARSWNRSEALLPESVGEDGQEDIGCPHGRYSRDDVNRPVPDELPGDAHYRRTSPSRTCEVIDGQEVVLVERQPKGAAENPVEGRRRKTEGRSFGDGIRRLEYVTNREASCCNQRPSCVLAGRRFARQDRLVGAALGLQEKCRALAEPREVVAVHRVVVVVSWERLVVREVLLDDDRAERPGPQQHRHRGVRASVVGVPDDLLRERSLEVLDDRKVRVLVRSRVLEHTVQKRDLLWG